MKMLPIFRKSSISTFILIMMIWKAAADSSDQECKDLVDHYLSYFDQGLGKCVIPYSHNCGTTPEDQASCGHNSHCSRRRYCACDLGFVAGIGDQHCYPAKSFGESCNYHGNCTRDSGMSCLKEGDNGNYSNLGNCGCDKDSFWNAARSYCIQHECSKRVYGAYLDGPSNQCLTKIGVLVVEPGTFGEEPLSVSQHMDRNLVFCPQKSSLVTKVGQGACLCDEGYVSNVARVGCFLKRTYGESCGEQNGDGSCYPSGRSGLVCQGGICGCGEGGTWKEADSVCYSAEYCRQHYSILPFKYEASTQTCVGSIGELVYLPLFDGVLNCPAHSRMKLDSKYTGYAKCECLQTFSTSENSEECIPV